MKTKGKAWQLILTVLVIAAFVYTAFFGVAVKYGDVTTTYIKGAKDIRFKELKDTISQLNTTTRTPNDLVISLQKVLEERNAKDDERDWIISNLQA